MEQLDNAPVIKWKNIWIPVLIGVGVSVYLVATTFNADALQHISWNKHVLTGLLIAVMSVVVRDAAYMYRIREITGKRLGWRKSLDVILLWEFGSAVTPGAVGGIALALYLLKKEGISYGRSTATIMYTTFLDNVAFVFVFSVLYGILGNNLFLVSGHCEALQGHIILEGIRSLSSKAWIGFAAMGVSALFLSLALFVVPGRTKRFFYRLSGVNLLKRFQNPLRFLGDEIELTATELKGQSVSFYIRTLSATVVSWMARYALANVLIWTFTAGNYNTLEVFARQYVLWVFLMIPSTPGASGLAEFSFMALNCEFIQNGLSATVAILWRLYSYYIYLLAGLLVLPRWVQRTSRLQ